MLSKLSLNLLVNQLFIIPLQFDASALDFTAQKSRIALKNPHARPPRDPRTLLQMPSLTPSPSKPTVHIPVRGPTGIPMRGMGGIGIKLPGKFNREKRNWMYMCSFILLSLVTQCSMTDNGWCPDLSVNGYLSLLFVLLWCCSGLGAGPPILRKTGKGVIGENNTENIPQVPIRYLHFLSSTFE